MCLGIPWLSKNYNGQYKLVILAKARIQDSQNQILVKGRAGPWIKSRVTHLLYEVTVALISQEGYHRHYVFLFVEDPMVSG